MADERGRPPAATSEDSPRIVDWTPELDAEAERIVGAVFTEYHIPFHPDNYDSDLREIPRLYLATGGMFRFLLMGGTAVATVAVRPLTDRECELKRLYMLQSQRGKGYGGLLLDEAIGWARETGFKSMVAWSDTRFEDAHRAYLSRGFVQFAYRDEPGPDPAEEFGFRVALAIVGS